MPFKTIRSKSIFKKICNSCQVSLACLVDYNGNYIEIKIGITKNIWCCNVKLITIYLFGDDTINNDTLKSEDDGMKTFYIKVKIYFRKYLTHIIILPKK